MNRCSIRHAALALVSAAAFAMPVLAEEREFDRAMQQYEQCHWQQAFESFSRLADQGDAQAARIAEQMVRYGVALYGRKFEATTAQLERWRVSAVAAVAAVADAKR
jgi:hypothetical protein